MKFSLIIASLIGRLSKIPFARDVEFNWSWILRLGFVVLVHAESENQAATTEVAITEEASRVRISVFNETPKTVLDKTNKGY